MSQYDSGVPVTIEPYPERTLVDVVHETAELRPDHTALWFKGARISYGKLDRLAEAFGRGLHAAGISPGDRVALLMPNSPQAVIAQFGAWKAGAIVAPLNPLHTEPELERTLVDIGAETIVVLTPFYRKVKAVQQRTGLRHVVATNIKEFLTPASRALFTLLKEASGGHRVTLQRGDRWFADVVQAGRLEPAATPPPVPADPALLLLTGGTTGVPKAALGTHGALLRSAMQAHAWFGPVLREWDDLVVLAMPLFHVYGNVGILATSLIGRHPIALVPNPRDLSDVLRTIERTRAAFFPAVPTLFTALLNHPKVDSGRADFSSLKLCISGSAPLLAETRRRFEGLTGGRIVDAYSITEAMNAAVINPVGRPPRPGAIGLPLPDVDLRVVDSDGNTEAPRGQDGQILIRAPQMMEGYWNRPTETAEAIVDGWLHTGDIGHVDEDGYVSVVDREKDMIKPGGLAVWPREIEEVIATNPSVAEVAVAGVPDSHQGEAVKAWVVPREGATLRTEELQAWCRERLAPYKVPRHVEFREALPKSHLGKVLRRALAAEPSGTRLEDVIVGGGTLSVEERGDGTDTIIFAHGVLLDKRMFDRQMEVLRDRYRCVAFDFRGHGRSEVTSGGYEVDALTQDTAGLIEQLDCSPCHFVGHSLGSFVGLRLAARHPDLVRSLILLAPSADPQPRRDVLRYRMMQAVARRVGMASLARPLMKTLFGKTFMRDADRAAERDEWRRRIATMSLAAAVRAVDGVLARRGVRDELPRIKTPTLVIRGDEDVAAPRLFAERVVAGIPGARLVTVSGAGHVAPVERPEEVTAAIDDFLKGIGTADPKAP